MAAERSSWGKIEKRMSTAKANAATGKKVARFVASYVWPPAKRGEKSQRHTPGHSFPTRSDAQGWLNDERKLIDSGEWTPPAERNKLKKEQLVTVSSYFETWLEAETTRRETTKNTYRSLAKTRITPYIGSEAIGSITETDINKWWTLIGREHADTKRRNSQAYSCLSTMFKFAVSQGLIDANPCQIPKAGKSPKPKTKQLLTDEEVQKIVDSMDERYRMALIIADHCSMRLGEWTELRRRDLEISEAGVRIHVQRGVSFIGGEAIIGDPKTEAGNRWITVHPDLVKPLLEHIDAYAQDGDDGLIFTNKLGGQIKHSGFREMLAQHSLAEIGRRVSPHDFRHHGATNFLRYGATVRDVMARVGHTTATMAMHYQHATQQRDAELAARMPVFSTKKAEEE
ncbi:tyrosine-type recombinase/integrase [Corynebacterium sp. H113]|uniref:tyrosine-type recombinase/integrase n=1 Tax=Corynebacterium sp. H113 TaxID=3133419 RepID=UPI0030B52A42